MPKCAENTFTNCGTPQLGGIEINDKFKDALEMIESGNNFFVSGLSGENLDKVLKIQKIKHGNYEIRNFYENEAERHKIKEHARGDLFFTEELWKLIRAGKITEKSGHVALKE